MYIRKTAISVIIAIIMLVSLITPALAETLSSTGIVVNNKALVSNVSPVYSNGSLLVPAKEFASALGGTFIYEDSTHTGKIAYGENELVFRLDNSIARYNGKNIQAPAPMKIINNRFMIPVEFTSKTLGAEVYTNSSKNQILIFQPVDGKIVYQVVSGDSLWIVSRLFGTSIATIKQINNLTSDVLFVGQQLIIKNYTPFSTIIPAQTTKNATLRSGAGFDYSPIAYVSGLVDISVVGKIGDWYKVMTPKGNGYMYYSILAVKQDLNDSAPNSSYFNEKIPVDTSSDYVTFTTYTVKSGDTIWSIAEKVGIPDYELAGANGMTMNSMIYIGQVLKVPVHNIPVKNTMGPLYGEVLDWFSEAQYVFPIGKVGKLIDTETGKSFMIKRTMGANHADSETLTTQDTQVMKEIFGGYWTWNRKSFILEVDGRRLAVSVSGMPHAGVDSAPYMSYVSNRSDNWGYGPNLDRIKGNGMEGHFDLYMLNCLRHKDNKIDSGHQYKVLISGGLQ